MLSYYYNAVAHRNMDTKNPVSTMSSEGAKRIMFKDFGGKKALQVLDRKEKMKVNVDVVKDALDKTLLGETCTQKCTANIHHSCRYIYYVLEFTNSLLNKQEDEFDKAKIQQDQHLEEIVPRMNKEAKKLVDVYKLTELIEPEALDCLNDEAVNVLKTTGEDQK